MCLQNCVHGFFLDLKHVTAPSDTGQYFFPVFQEPKEDIKYMLDLFVYFYKVTVNYVLFTLRRGKTENISFGLLYTEILWKVSAVMI